MTSQNPDAIEEMYGRIETLNSQIERAGNESSDLRSRADALDAQSALWAKLSRDYKKILDTYAQSLRLI